jgi:peptidoglycan/LPS O-acetylase OafA/YrhL
MNRLPGLDLLRAIAIVWVMLFHSFVVGGLGDRFDWLQGNGWIGVDLFFVLSGYLIGAQVLGRLSRGEPLAFADFYLRRAFRVLPAFWTVLALYALWPAFREAPGLQPPWQFLSFTLNLLIDYRHNPAFSHAWSLCVEEHFYLLFPFLAWWMTRRPSLATFVAVCMLTVAVGMAIRGYVWMHVMAPLRGVDNVGFGVHFVEDIYYPTWARLDGLLAGVALAAVKAYRPMWWAWLQARANPLSLLGLGVTGVALWLFRNRLDLLPTVVGYPLLAAGLALLVLAGAGRTAWLGRLRVPGVGWIAAVSYSLYLSHKAVMHLVHGAFGAWLEGKDVIAFAVYAVAVLLGGALLYYGVERPFLRWRERLGTHRAVQSEGAELAHR